jgi:CubicO group peptidase (beta-lactamase class C family)
MNRIPSSNFLCGVLLLASFFVTSCTTLRILYYNVPDLKVRDQFPKRHLVKSPTPFNFVNNALSFPVSHSINIDQTKWNSFEEFLEENETVAFLAIRNDTILYEKYFEDFQDDRPIPSFSIAKSFVSALVGCAIDEGYMGSVQDPVIKYVPELKNKGLDDLTIEHLLQMTAGLKYKEHYWYHKKNLAYIFYTDDLNSSVFGLKAVRKVGEKHEYQSIATQLLGLALSRSLADQTVTEYLQEKIWTPLQMEYDASWDLDREDGIEKTFCCLNACARDYAKFGRLYLNEGEWEGKQVVPREWVRRSLKIDSLNGSAPHYQYLWRLDIESSSFYAKGFFSQLVYVNPERNLIFVRLGKRSGDVDWVDFLSAQLDFFGRVQPENSVKAR